MSTQSRLAARQDIHIDVIQNGVKALPEQAQATFIRGAQVLLAGSEKK